MIDTQFETQLCCQLVICCMDLQNVLIIGARVPSRDQGRRGTPPNNSVIYRAGRPSEPTKAGWGCAPTGSDRQADARPSRSVGMDLVCVTLRWRGVDSNHQYRVTPPRFREGVISAPLDSHQPKGSTNENRHHGNAEGSCDLRPVSDLHDGIGIQPTLRSGRDATSLVHEPTVGTAATGDNGCGSCCG